MKSMFAKRLPKASVARRVCRRTQRRLFLENLEDRCLLAAGVLDSSFGVGGIVTTNFIPVAGTPGWSDVASSVALQADGKIVVAGTTEPNGGHRVAISRYNTDGSLDTSFDLDGKVSDTAIWSARDLVLQPDGKIVVTGGSPEGFNGNFSLGRYNVDGSKDSSFGSGGHIITNPGIYDEAHAVTILDDGKLLVAGHSGQLGPLQPQGFALQKFNANGTVDTSFGNMGQVRTFFPLAEVSSHYGGVGNAGGRDLVVQPDGKILVAGYSFGANNKFAVVRYNSNGTLDTSFDGDGRVVTSLGAGRSYGLRMALQADGKVVVGGYFVKATTPDDADFALVRYNPDGSLDTTFNGDGKLTVDFGGTNDYLRDVTIQSDGAIVVTGSAGNALAVARFKPDGTPDTTFGTSGRVTTTIQASLGGTGVVVQPDGAIVVAGTVNNGRTDPFTNRDFAVLRYGGISNTPPVVAASTAAVSADEGSTVSNSGTFSDAQGNDTVTLTATVGGTSFGTVIKNDALGTWSWSADVADGPAGPFTVTVTATDTLNASANATFTYSVNNLDPDAVDDVFSAFEDGSAQTLDLLGNDSDPAGANDPLSITSVDATGTVGQVTLDDGVVSYSPNGQFESLGANETATDTFTYSISDGDGGSDTATVTMTIIGLNDAPTAAGTLPDLTVNQNAADTAINLAGLFHDVDANDTLTITAVSSSSGLVTASVSGNLLTLDYQPNQNGAALITVTATDGSGASVDVAFNVAVLSPAHLANGIIQLINQWKSDGKINSGVANSMIVKVVNSLKSYDKGNLNAAAGQLGALKNEIHAKVKPGSLVSADATLAISLLDELYDAMTV